MSYSKYWQRTILDGETAERTRTVPYRTKNKNLKISEKIRSVIWKNTRGVVSRRFKAQDGNYNSSFARMKAALCSASKELNWLTKESCSLSRQMKLMTWADVKVEACSVLKRATADAKGVVLSEDFFCWEITSCRREAKTSTGFSFGVFGVLT